MPDAGTVVARAQAGGRERGGKGRRNAETEAEARSNDTISQEVDDILTRTSSIVKVPGYVGKPKGLKQVLFEGGLCQINEEGKFPTAPEMKVTLDGHTDFVHEVSILEEIMVLRSHILLQVSS